VAVGGTELHAPVVDENEVRAAAGLTMAIGAVAFGYAYFTKQYLPLQVVASLLFVEFLIRMMVGLRYSPIGALARGLTFTQPPDWVSAKPKRFAWTLGLGMTFAMAIITNIGIRGTLPRTICLICLTLMWMESALGVCLGCKIYSLAVRRGWTPTDPETEVCADGSGEQPHEHRPAPPRQPQPDSPRPADTLRRSNQDARPAGNAREAAAESADRLLRRQSRRGGAREATTSLLSA